MKSSPRSTARGGLYTGQLSSRDVAILVSGDQDYVPAVRRVKDFGKTLINVSFLTRNGRLLPGGARRLNNATDAGVQLPFEELRAHLCPDHSAAVQSGIVIPRRD
jgi:hypothetical protein